MLKLPDAARRLPTLANNCYIVGEAKRADVIWSEGDFKALCEHMLNENPLSHFLNVWIDASGQAGPGAQSLEGGKVRQGLVFIHQTPKDSPAGLRLILTPIMGNTSKHGNGRYKP